jgi:hypothetical protein
MQLVVRGADTPTAPFEELAAIVNASGADLTIALRTLASPRECTAILTPKAVPMPSQAPGPVGTAELRSLVAQIAASSRAQASLSLRAALVSVIRSCPRNPLESEQYLLDATTTPIVILTVGTSDAAGLAQQIPALLERWIAQEEIEGAA